MAAGQNKRDFWEIYPVEAPEDDLITGKCAEKIRVDLDFAGEYHFVAKQGTYGRITRVLEEGYNMMTLPQKDRWYLSTKGWRGDDDAINKKIVRILEKRKGKKGLKVVLV